MENKYYTPSIEEFRVGFEYEQVSINPQEDITISDKLKYEKCKFPDPFVGYCLDKLNLNTCRVKYLDQEDIESLGFTETNYLENTDYAITFEKQHKNGKAEITYWYSIHYIEIYTAEDVDTQFQGYCKNKSELKVLLKQLEID